MRRNLQNFRKVAPKRNKINLENYDYQKDIKNRLLMSTFTAVEVDIIEAVINNSLIIKLEDLALELDVTVECIEPFLEKISSTGLFKIKNRKLEVDKEMRKYYEFQIEKFEDSFEPDIEFIKGVFRKVPIDVLPIWYSLPKITDDIFNALIEKCLSSPSTYLKYTREDVSEDEILNKVMQEILVSQEDYIKPSYIREKYNLSKEEFELYMLYLEFNFVGYLVYQKEGDDWCEIIKPFHEWKVYLEKERNAMQDLSDCCVERLYQDKDNFLIDMRTMVNYLMSNFLLAKMVDGCYFIEEEDCLKISEFFGKDLSKYYINMLINKISLLKLIDDTEGVLSIDKNNVDEFINIDDEELAIYLLRHRRGTFFNFDVDYQLAVCDKNQRNIIKSFVKLLNKDWVYLDEFINTIEYGVGNSEDIHLARVNFKWEYVFPNYSKNEIDYIEAVILERAFQSGLIQIGEYNGRKCIKLTDLGENIVLKY